MSGKNKPVKAERYNSITTTGLCMHQWRSQSLALYGLHFVHMVSDIMSAVCQSNDAERARARAAPPELFDLENSIAALYRLLDETGR